MTVATYMKYYVKRWLTSKAYWFWSVAFMALWLVMGYIYIDHGLTSAPLEMQLRYTAAWYVMTLSLGVASAAVGLARLLFYSSIPVRYLVKYSRLTARRLYACMTTGFILVGLMTAGILAAIVIPLYGVKLSDVYPANPLLLAVAAAALSAIYFAVDVIVVCLTIILRAFKSAEYVCYTPLILGMGLVTLQLNTNIGQLAMLSPINAAAALLYSGYTGLKPIAGPFTNPLAAPTLQPLGLWFSILAWLVVLSVLGVVLLRLQEGVGAEEIRLL